MAPGKEGWGGVRLKCASLERGEKSAGQIRGERAPAQRLHSGRNTHILTVTPCTSRAPSLGIPFELQLQPRVRIQQWLQLHTCFGEGGRGVLHVTGHERSLPIKQTGKQTLNLNVNESAVGTSEASRLLREQLHQPQNLWLPSPSRLPLCLITH